MKISVKVISSLGLLLMMCFACNKTSNNPDTTSIPIIGHSFKVDYGTYVFRLDFISETQMTYTVLKGDNVGSSETVTIGRVEIRPNVFLVYWQENDQTTVTHVEDFVNGIVYSNITWPNKTFDKLKGTLTSIQ